MLDPYKMVVVNGILFISLILFIFIYIYIFPKKKLSPVLIVILFSFLPVISIFRYGDYESGDFNTHVYRAMAFFGALQDGQLIPSWPEDLNATYGYPLFIFLNPLPYYIISFLHLVSFSFIMSTKLYLALTFILSGVTMYLFSNLILKNKITALVVSISYLFAPYHLVDLHFRATVGESFIFTLLPMVFYFLEKMLLTKKIMFFILTSFFISCMFLTHQAMAIFTLPLIFCYAPISAYARNKSIINSIFWVTISILFGMILSSYTVLPHITYPIYTYAHVLSQQVVSFPHFTELLYSSWRFGFLFQGPTGQLSPFIGFGGIITFITGLYVLMKFRYKNKTILFFFICSLFLVFMITPYSSFIWTSIPILNTAQFSTRLLLIVVFCLSMASSLIPTFFNKWVSVLFIGIVILTSILNWGHRRIIPEITDETLQQNLSYSTVQGEGFCCMGSPRWTDINNPWQKTVPENHLEVLSGEAEIQEVFRNSIKHEYVVLVKDHVILKENTYFFPGWKARVNGKEIEINPSNKTYPGIITLTLPQGLYDVKILYSDLFLHTLSKWVSTIGNGGVIVYLFFLFFKKVFHTRNYIQNLFLRYPMKKRKR